jgi:hypothetical protein
MIKKNAERRDREQKTDLGRKLAPVKQQLAATLQKAHRMTRMYWSQSLKHVADLIDSGMVEVDPGVQFPQTDDHRAAHVDVTSSKSSSHVKIQSRQLLTSVLEHGTGQNLDFVNVRLTHFS